MNRDGKEENPASIRCLTMLLRCLQDSSTVPLRLMPAAPRFTQMELRMLKNAHDAVTIQYGATTVQAGSATTASRSLTAMVELRFRPRPQSTTIHPECFKRFKIVVALPRRFRKRQDSPRIITVLLRFMPMSLRCYYKSCRCATI